GRMHDPPFAHDRPGRTGHAFGLQPDLEVVIDLRKITAGQGTAGGVNRRRGEGQQNNESPEHARESHLTGARLYGWRVQCSKPDEMPRTLALAVRAHHALVDFEARLLHALDEQAVGPGRPD